MANRSLDRVLGPHTGLPDAAKCALISIEETLKSNVSVGLPVDLVVYPSNKLESQTIVCIDEENPYFKSIRDTWSHSVREAFDRVENPSWDEAATPHPLRAQSERFDAMKKIRNPNERII
ncbi:MAG: hypothetical protein QM756_09670 [Polyangiaceae bacterium]